MDLLYGSDQNLCDMDDEMNGLMDNDVFPSPPTMTSGSYMDDEWINSFFEDPVLNDKMITDAARPPRIASEHSYSSAVASDMDPDSSLGDMSKLEDLESDLLLPSHALDLSKHATSTGTSLIPKIEPVDHDPILMVSTASPTIMTRTFTVTKQQPTIILATAAGQTNLSERSVLPTITVKQEPPDFYDYLDSTVHSDTLVLPPTPPSSNNSDSDSCPSPQHSAPSSPVRQLPYSRQLNVGPYSPTSSSCSLSPTDSSSRHYTSSLYSSRHDSGIDIVFQQIPTSGILMLSEEEKRTLISEGYPVPNKLPLTKQEEKNLKKIRRKIKNKISAQESRRKKKEYLEALEKRVESFSHENGELKKKVDNLETNNRSLLGQLQKLQSLVGKIPRPSGAVPQTGTALMVLVLCFAVFLGSWSPTSLNIGYSTSNLAHPMPTYANPQLLKPAPMMGPTIEGAKVDAYCTPNTKSRVLLSLRGEQDDLNPYQFYGPNVPSDDQYSPQMSAESVKTSGDKLSEAVVEMGQTQPVGENVKELGQVTGVVGAVTETKEEVVKVTVDGRFGQTNFSAGLEGKTVDPGKLDVMAKAEGLVESADTI